MYGSWFDKPTPLIEIEGRWSESHHEKVTLSSALYWFSQGQAAAWLKNCLLNSSKQRKQRLYALYCVQCRKLPVSAPKDKGALRIENDLLFFLGFFK